MRSMICITALLFIFGCGKEAVTNKSSNTTGISNLSEGWRVMQISVPAPGMVGGTTTFKYNGKSYLMGSQTPQNIKNYVYSLSLGTSMTRNVLGQFGRENGNFPNPTVEFDVIHIQQIQ